ncbi:MAG: hypothetical protein KC469_10775 [Flavobacteriaceae bacterium]|nr:hypothetical protein [Flavobacteriaceae bacterium]
MNVQGSKGGAAYINDIVLGDKEVRAKVLAPLPNLGIWYYVAPFKNLVFMAKLDWFSLLICGYSGRLWNVSLGVNYQILNKLGIGLNYRFLTLLTK